MAVLLIEIEGYDTVAGATVTKRYATAGYNVADAPGPFEGIIRNRAGGVQITREIAGEGGPARRNVSEIQLMNRSGLADDLKDVAVAGRPITGRLVDDVRSAYSTADTFFVATMAPLEWSRDRVSIPVRDKLDTLAVPVQTAFYGGTGGLDGGAELEGKPRPLPLGDVFNVAAPFVDPALLIYEISAGEDADIATDGVKEGGRAVWTREADYASESDMLNNAPSSGAYRVWPRSSGSGGYVRLGSSTELPVTFDIEASRNRIGSLLEALILRAPALSASDIDASAVSALDSAIPHSVGWWSLDERQVATEAQRAAQGAGVWYGFNRLGVLDMGILEAPTGPPVATFKEAAVGADGNLASDEFDTFEITPLRGTIPASRLVARYGRNHAPGGRLAGGIPQADKTRMTDEWLTTSTSDASVETAYLNAQTITRDTPFYAKAGATDLTGRLFPIWKEERGAYRLRVEVENAIETTLDLDKVVLIDIDRWDLSGGRIHRIRRITLTPRRDLIEIEVWG